MEKSIQVLRIIGISLLLIFLLFFALGSMKEPLIFELKHADNSELIHSPTTPTGQAIERAEKRQPDKQREFAISDTISIKKQEVFSTSSGPIIETPEGAERVLLIGDSQLDGLRSPVSAYCEKNNHVLLSTIIWYGSSTKQWATTDTLDYYLKRYKPTVVLFAIGLNELFVRDLDARASYIRAIKRKFDQYSVRYSWMGPAAWTKDKGIVSLMAKEVGTNFYPSHTLQLERANDGRHPSKSGSKVWFDHVAEAITQAGIINFSQKVSTLPRLKFTRTILLTI